MRIENAFTRSLEVQETLNTSLNSAQGAQFSLMLSLMMAPVYSPDLPELYANLPVAGAASIYPAHIPTRYDPPGMSALNRVQTQSNLVLVEDTYGRQLASRIQSSMGIALVQGQPAYFSWLRALTEEYPKLQFVTTLKPAQAPSPRQVAATYAAQAKPDTETLIQQLNSIKTAA